MQEIGATEFKMDDRLTWLIFLIAGFVVTIWSYCIFVASICGRHGLYDGEIFIYVVAFLSHVIISLSTTGALISGLKNKDSDLLTPWMSLKVIELVGLFAAIIIQCSSFNNTIAIVPVAVIVKMIGCYILLCIYCTWQKMKDNQQRPTTLTSADHLELEQTPSYITYTS